MKIKLQFFIGTYSEKGAYIPQANGKGIMSCTIDPGSGQIQQVNLCKEATNATYLAKAPTDNILFAACDRFISLGEVKAFTIAPNGSLRLLSSQNAHGTSTCHLACGPQGRRIFVASYGDGKLTAHQFDGKMISPDPQIIAYEGAGPNVERQEAAHVHQVIVSPNGKWLYACDLGSDRIWLHDLSHAPGDLQVRQGIEVPAGYGPRHLVCHPTLPLTYVFCELNSHLLTYSRDDQSGLMTLIADESTLPADYTGIPSGAAIKLHPSLKALYVSNRGHHSLTAFSIDDTDGHLKFETRFSTGGKEPRDFSIDPTGRWLLAANQHSDNIVPFRLDPFTGLPAGEAAPPFPCGTPVCILFD